MFFGSPQSCNPRHKRVIPWTGVVGHFSEKLLSPGSVIGQGRAAYAAVSVGYLRQGFLQVVLIKQRSCGLG